MAYAPTSVTVVCPACGTEIVLPTSITIQPHSTSGSVVAALHLDQFPLTAHVDACPGRHVQPSDIVTDEANAHIAACAECQRRFPLVAEMIRHG